MKQAITFPNIPTPCSVSVLCRQREVSFTVDPISISLIVNTVLENEAESADFTNVHFLSDRSMRQYHKRFFDDPTSTDCMSFPLDEKSHEGEPRHLGDIFVCPKTALLYAKNSEEGFWNELLLYIVHGILHLLGYEDTDQTHRTHMRQRERSALKLLRKKNISICGTLKIKTQI